MAPESFKKNYHFQADLYSLGLIIWEVAKLIKFWERRHLFHNLVNDKDQNLVKQHPTNVESVRSLILALSKKETAERLQNMHSVFNITFSWKFAHFSKCVADFRLEQGDAIPTSILRRLIYPARNYVVKNADGLRKCLNKITSGSTITMKEGNYELDFILRGENITLTGVAPFGIEIRGRLNVIGSGNNIFNLNFNSSLLVHGDRNHIMNVNMSGSEDKILITGNRNILKNTFITSGFGVILTGCQNIVDGLKIRRCVCVTLYTSFFTDHKKIFSRTLR